MAVCIFLGHRNCPDNIKTKLHCTIVDLIVNHQVDLFYVGHQGQFDRIAYHTLRKIRKTYPHIRYAVVLAYLTAASEYDHYTDTMLPEGIETVHPKYAISWRNNWMLLQADYVISYITHSWGGAAKYAQKALKQGKIVINIAENG